MSKKKFMNCAYILDDVWVFPGLEFSSSRIKYLRACLRVHLEIAIELGAQAFINSPVIESLSQFSGCSVSEFVLCPDLKL